MRAFFALLPLAAMVLASAMPAAEPAAVAGPAEANANANANATGKNASARAEAEANASDNKGRPRPKPCVCRIPVSCSRGTPFERCQCEKKARESCHKSNPRCPNPTNICRRPPPKCECNTSSCNSIRDEYKRCACIYNKRVECDRKPGCDKPVFTCKVPFKPCGGKTFARSKCDPGYFCYQAVGSPKDRPGKCWPTDPYKCSRTQSCPSRDLKCADDPRTRFFDGICV